LIIVRTNPAIIKLIVSEVVVMMIKIRSNVGSCRLPKKPAIELSKLLVIPDDATPLTITKEITRRKITDNFVFQKGLTVSLYGCVVMRRKIT
jgi:hypothetical protein